ncbi:MAG TPA: response regulator transcription factor [Pseudonocardiaceae bacterium]|jgi:two-component system nitrate/nitrite response regulator NarL|nr:response regulator transcription factor [Pseudonocardiaceae bacterium]
MTDLVLASDHLLFVDALGTLLAQRGFTVCGIAHSHAEAVEAVGRHRPDVCVFDDHSAGAEIVGRIVAASARTKVLVLTADHDQDATRCLLRSGAAGYLHKSCGIAALTAAISRILRDELVVDRPASRPTGASADARRLATHLTGRERECLALLVQGLGTVAMAGRLGVSTMTVRTHVQALLTKLGVHSRLAAASFAVRHGLLDDCPPRIRPAASDA